MPVASITGDAAKDISAADTQQYVSLKNNGRRTVHVKTQSFAGDVAFDLAPGGSHMFPENTVIFSCEAIYKI